MRFRPDHWLLIEDGRIAGVAGRGARRELDAPRPRAAGWILPGFIDTHVHSPQLDVIASYGTELLDWLTTHTFPAERATPIAAHAEAGAALFLDALLAHGTTAAVVFPTVHKAVGRRAVRGRPRRAACALIAGKVLMDRHAPDGLRDDVAQAERDCQRLIARWHGKGRLAYAVTVRFAPTSSPEQLAMAGRLCAADPSLYMQTHVAENRAEVRLGRASCSPRRAATSTSTRAPACCTRRACSRTASGSTTPTAPRCARPARRSRIQPVVEPVPRQRPVRLARAPRRPASHVSLASDVGGGTSLSMLRTMAEAYKVQALAGAAPDRLEGAARRDARRGARRSGSSDEIGSLEPAATADVCVWDWAVGPVAARRARGGPHIARARRSPG